ncbi:MAG TPA: hypothetical protein GX530_09505 [Corynebacteriales bacterium]|jgi:hypothetical protein|nr:hypothetical protein [Mycobacteriales bacterium]
MKGEYRVFGEVYPERPGGYPQGKEEALLQEFGKYLKERSSIDIYKDRNIEML